MRTTAQHAKPVVLFVMGVGFTGGVFAVSGMNLETMGLGRYSLSF
jgi:hypothetical protein